MSNWNFFDTFAPVAAEPNFKRSLLTPVKVYVLNLLLFSIALGTMAFAIHGGYILASVWLS